MEKHHNEFHIALQLHNLQFGDLLKNMVESLKVELLKLFFHSKVYQQMMNFFLSMPLNKVVFIMLALIVLLDVEPM